MFAASPARQRQCLTKCTNLSLRPSPRLTYSIPEVCQWQRCNPITTTANSSSSSAVANPSPTPKRVIFSGIQPTGVPHLGNYLGALREWVLLQNSSTAQDTTLLYSIVDLHALTLPQDPEVLRTWRRQSFATLLAVGLDPERCSLFFQSAVPEHAELMWILSTVSSMGYLSRMTQWKSKLQLPEKSTLEDTNARAKLKLGLFSYPVLMAADILLYSATHVPVGEDQKQHIEFAREVANGFNYIYGPVLTMPEPLISPARRVMSLKQPKAKMSKSDADPRSRILLTDTAEVIRSKILGALTDSISPLITYDPVQRPGVANLIEILAHVSQQPDAGSASRAGVGAEAGEEFAAVAAQHENVGLRAFKEHVAEKLVAHLAPIRERYLQLMSDEKRTAELDEIAWHGAQKARENAAETMSRVREAVGIN
ncbi:hypothetical protein VTO42DRAFT_685 [Malbranchea cinnamomea]